MIVNGTTQDLFLRRPLRSKLLPHIYYFFDNDAFDLLGGAAGASVDVVVMPGSYRKPMLIFMGGHPSYNGSAASTDNSRHAFVLTCTLRADVVNKL
jgi:hypothetical protein